MGKAKAKKKPTKPAGQSRQCPDNDTEEVVPHRKLYVANLAGMEMTEAKFRQLFEDFGDIVSIDLVCTKNHTFGFVEFATVPEATCALERRNGESGMIVKYARITSGPPSAPLAAANRTDAHEEDSGQEEETEDEKEQNTREADAIESEVNSTSLVHPAPYAAAAQAYPNPVENLQALVQKSTRAGSTRDNIMYSIEETDFDFIATLKLVVPSGTRTSVGQPRENKQAAKQSAAQVALRDPEVHKLLPPPSKVEKPKAAKSVESNEDHGHENATTCINGSSPSGSEQSEVEEEVIKPGPHLSAKKQKQLEQAELRAKKRAKRKAAKAAKAAQVEESSEEEEETDEGACVDVEDTDESDTDDSEEDGDEVESTTDEDADEDADIDSVAFRKAAIKAALAAKRAGRRSGKQQDSTKEKASVNSKQPKLDKGRKDDMYGKVEDTRKQANYGQTKFIKP